jgi:hypothetical protein
MELSETKDLFDLLQVIKERPGMYVLNNTYDEQFRELEVLFLGYELALSNYNISEVGSQFRNDFGGFLRSKYHWSMSCGPMAAIRLEFESSEKAWFKFWELLELYKSSLSES